MGTSGDILDRSQYTVIPHVAVVDECTLPIPSKEVEGEFEYFTIDAAFLERVAFNGNRREAETGDLCPLVIGRHTKKNAAETAQPEIVGYARNWSTGPLGSTQRQAAYVDFWVKNEEVARVKKFPRRSAEIWRGRAEIDPIALLGATTPERDLGMLPIALNRAEALSGRSCTTRRHNDQEISATFYCDRGFDMPTEVDNKAGQGKQDATPDQADIIQAINKLTAVVTDLQAAVSKMTTGTTGGDAEEGQPGGPDGQPGEPGGDMDDAELQKLIAELEGQGGAGGPPGAEGAAPPGAAGAPGAGQPPRKEEGEPVKTMGYPGGGNTFVPGKEQPARAGRDAEMDALRAEVDAIRLERATEVVTAKINDLEKAGVIFEDKAAEVRDILALPSEMRPAMLSRIEKSYKRVVPGNGQVLPSVDNAASGVAFGGITEEQKNEVIQLARADSSSFEVAYKKKFGHFPWEKPKL